MFVLKTNPLLFSLFPVQSDRAQPLIRRVSASFSQSVSEVMWIRGRLFCLALTGRRERCSPASYRDTKHISFVITSIEPSETVVSARLHWTTNQKGFLTFPSIRFVMLVILQGSTVFTVLIWKPLKIQSDYFCKNGSLSINIHVKPVVVSGPCLLSRLLYCVTKLAHWLTVIICHHVSSGLSWTKSKYSNERRREPSIC